MPAPNNLSWEKSPLTELLRLAWPTVISLVSLSVMTLVDTLFIGRLGAVPLAAAGIGGVCVFTVISFGLAIFSTAKVKVGEKHGAGDRAGVNRSLGSLIRLALALGFTSVLVGWLAAAALPWLSADDQTGILAGKYAALRSFGFPFVLVSAAIAQWLQAQGDAKTAMRAALAANVANVPLNLILIFGLGWGVPGAGIATASSRIVEAIWLLNLQRKTSIPLENGGRTTPGFHLRHSTWGEAWLALKVGLPTGLERVLDMVAFAAVPLLLSQVGPVHVAAHQIVLQLMLFSFLPLFALNESVSVLVAQAVGADRKRLVRLLSNLGLAAAMIYASVYGVLCLSLSPQLIGVFTPDRGVIRAGSAALILGALLQFLNAAYTHFKGVLRGLSIFSFVAWVTVGCAWVVTPPLTYAFGVYSGEGVVGAWKALCLEVALGIVFLIWKVRRQPAYRLR